MKILMRKSYRAAWLVVFLFAFFLQPQKVSAATISVDRTDDEASANACTAAPNDCSLRGAITFANANPGLDTINLPAGTYTLSITGVNENANLSGDLDITDSSGLTITGEDAETTIINQTTADRVLEILGGSFTLKNITISGGNPAAFYYGGGLEINSGASVTINSSIFKNNTGDRGGALHNTSGTVTITDSQFTSNNSLAGGGAIGNYGSSMSLTNCTLTGNTTPPGGYQGAGIFNNTSSNLNVINTLFLNNQGTGAGAGIANLGTVNITGSTFNGNSTTSTIGGGGLYNTGTATVTGSTFVSNSANNGGGIINYYNSLTLSNSTLNNNSANNGGGVYNNANLTLTNSTVTNNSAILGGGLFNNVNMTLTNNTLVNNSASSQGDGILNNSLDAMGYSSSLKNNIIASVTPGDSCNVIMGTITIDNTNLAADNTCGSATQTTNIELNLGTLTDRGGPTQIIPLLEGSVAIDAGDPAVCAAAPVNNLDQRGSIRPLDGNGDQTAICDVGAYETDTPALPEVESISLNTFYTSGPSTFDISFNKNMLNSGGGSGEDDVTNPDNYLLVEAGNNGVFNTISCGPVPGTGGVKQDDVQITVNQVTFNSSTYTSTVTINNSTGLPNGSYRLFLCATSTLRDLGGQPINSGADVTFNFTVSGGESLLPATGFPQGSISALPIQPAEKAYTSLDMLLEIPSQNIRMDIIGVPATKDGWDVTWLEDNAGYLEGSAFPTWEGNTVLTGHVWTADNQPGPFAEVKSLKYGDQILIHAWGTTYVYEIRESRQIKPGDLGSVLQHEELDWLTLLTCESYNETSGTYLSRRLVRAVLINTY